MDNHQIPDVIEAQKPLEQQGHLTRTQLYIVTAFLSLIAIGLSGYLIWDTYNDGLSKETKNIIDDAENGETPETETNNDDQSLEEDESANTSEEETISDDVENEIDTSKWKTFSFNSTTNDPVNTNTYMADDEWNSYSLVENIPVIFSFKYPTQWNQNENEIVFSDQLGMKVLQLSPPGLVVLDGDICFGGKRSSGCGVGACSETVNYGDFKLNEINGTYQIDYVSNYEIPVKYLYVHNYCIEHGDNAVILRFNDWSLVTTGERNALYDAVIKTVDFSE